MLSIKTLKELKDKKAFRTALLFLFLVLFFATRLPRLKDDIVNPDGTLWHYRSEQFVSGIKQGQLEKTYQNYHPGTTLMWISGISIEVFKQMSGIKSYSSENFLTFDLVAKLSVIFVQLILSIFIIFLFSKLVGFYKSFLTVSIFTFEPWFLANSRLYHLDVLLTLLIFISIIFAYINMKEPSIKNSVLTGFFVSLSFLTKSVALGLLIFVTFCTSVYLFKVGKKDKIFSSVGSIFLSFIFFTLLLLPALWVNPKYCVSTMISETKKAGIERGHSQIMFGKETNNGGVFFYPLVVLLKVSPFTIIGSLLGFYYFISRKIKDKKFSEFSVYLLIFVVGYLIGMTVPSKKIDRYILVIFPFLAYSSVVGYKSLFENLKNESQKTIFKITVPLMLVVFWVIPYFTLFPWYFVYTSPLFGSPCNANKIIGQKPFGVGIPDLEKLIIDRYGDKYEEEGPRMGFYDTQPMEAIYPNSKVYNVRTYGPKRYNLLILGINEDLPRKVLENEKYYFKKDYSLWINGLEYWRIYTIERVQ
jgi:hypothetical protein